MNGNDELIKLLKDVAATPLVDLVQVKGTYYDRVRMVETRYAENFTPQQLSGAVVLPENLNASFSVIGRLPKGESGPIPDAIDRLREQADLDPLPFRWICAKTAMVNGRIQYEVLPGGTRA